MERTRITQEPVPYVNALLCKVIVMNPNVGSNIAMKTVIYERNLVVSLRKQC